MCFFNKKNMSAHLLTIIFREKIMLKYISAIAPKHERGENCKLWSSHLCLLMMTIMVCKCLQMQYTLLDLQL